MKRREHGSIKIRKMRALLKGKNPVKTEQGVMSLQNLLKTNRLSPESKSLLQTRAPTKEELLIKVTPAESLIVLKFVLIKVSLYHDLDVVCTGSKFGSALDSWDEVEIPQTRVTRQASIFKLAKKNGLESRRLL